MTCHIFSWPGSLVLICHSNVIHRKMCVIDVSGTTASRILKFGTNVGYDFLYCVNPLAYFPLIGKLRCPSVRRPSILFKHLLRNCWANSSQISYGVPMDGRTKIYSQRWPPCPYMTKTLSKSSSPKPAR